MPLISPFRPIRLIKDGQNYIASVSGRRYIFGVDGCLQSILVNGKEILSSPIRFVGSEQGEPMTFYDNYDQNESEIFVSKRDDESILLCGTMRSKRFIINQKIQISYDGSIDVAVNLMPVGQTVAEIFGVDPEKRPAFKLDNLAMEIPFQKDICTHYSMYPWNEITLSDGTVLKKTPMSNSGLIPQEKDMYFPFEALLWLGREERGLGIYADNWKGRELDDPKHAMELIHTEDGNCKLRVRLLDHHPTEWKVDPKDGCYAYGPISFRFGLMATPVKEFPKNPYVHNALHLDCFIKTPGNYIDFLTKNNYFDRLQEKGVNTLILHEKWNKQQNCFTPSEYTLQQIKAIVEECHARNIRVLTYFGYEISTLTQDFDEDFEQVRNEVDGHHTGGWFRVPYQRDYCVCYHSSLQEKLLNGIQTIMDTCHTDGVYLDGTATPIYCTNPRHGCQWLDENERAQGTYPVRAVRNLFRQLYQIVHSRGGYLSVHAYGCVNFTALPYIDLNWYGENLQFDYITGKFSDVPLDYFRAEYTGRNMGVPVEFIAYEKRPIWNFENALAISLVHGILPRPNDIEGPLDTMSTIWKILGAFPLDKSTWHPYWNNLIKTSDDKVKLSYYQYKSLTGKTNYLIFLSNTACTKKENVTFTLPEKNLRIYDVTDGNTKEYLPSITMDPYSYRIFVAE